MRRGPVLAAIWMNIISLLICGSIESASLDEQLIVAASKGQNQEVLSLLNKGADINAKNKIGNTALMFAATYEYPDIVQILLENGADVNVKTKEGSTPLTYAKQKGHKAIVQLLQEAGAKE